MAKVILMFASISGILAVGLGAFGAHALKDRLQQAGYDATYHTAVHYQFYHTLGLALLGILMMIKGPSNWLAYSGYSMMAGIVLFSGSLYVLSIFEWRWMGIITPIGGLFLILSWLFLFIGVY